VPFQCQLRTRALMRSSPSSRAPAAIIRDLIETADGDLFYGARLEWILNAWLSTGGSMCVSGKICGFVEVLQRGIRS